MALSTRRFRTIAWICTACGLVTLFLSFTGRFAVARLRSLYEAQSQRLQQQLPPGPDPSLDRIARTFGLLSTFLPSAEMFLRSELVSRGRTAPVSPDLVFLGVDDLSIGMEPIDIETSARDIPRESRDFQALSLMSQGWPFNREVYALTLDKLVQAGARAVMLDFIFIKPAAGDRPLQAALERHRDKATVVCNFVPPSGSGGITSGGGKNVFQLPPASLLPNERPRDVIGLANFFPSKVDGNIWDAKYRVNERELAGFPIVDDPDDEYLALTAKAISKLSLGDRIPPGTGPTAFRYAGPAGTFKARSFQEIFFPSLWERNYANGAYFKGKLVILGPYGNWAQDYQPTPLGPMPGPEVHLQALNALLTGAFVRETPAWLALLEVVLACLGVALLGRTGMRPIPRFLLAVGVGVLLVVAAAIAYNVFDAYLLTAPPLFALSTSGLLVFVHEFSVERLERARTRQFLEQTMSAGVARAVLDQPGFYERMCAGQRMPVTILFSDIRSFTTMTESADEAALVVQLNEYMDHMVECVFRHNGNLDKFIGDAVMAVWGNTPTAKGAQEDACDAVRCALEMLARLRVLNARWKTEGRPELHIGIGINSGEPIVGRIGSSRKNEITVIGDSVNTASRFEGLTKEYRLELLIGEQTAAHLQGRFILQHADFNKPKGKNKEVEIFNVLGEDVGDARTSTLTAGLSDYQAGLDAYFQRVKASPREDDPTSLTEAKRAERRALAAAAAAGFEAALAQRPNDFLVERYLRLTAAKILEGDDAAWDAVTVMTKK